MGRSEWFRKFRYGGSEALPDPVGDPRRTAPAAVLADPRGDRRADGEGAGRVGDLLTEPGVAPPETSRVADLRRGLGADMA